MKGIAYLVGAGPGDPGLATLRARELIERADLIVYDYLCNPDLLQWARPGVETLYAGKTANRHTFTQDEINLRLVEAVQSGKTVVRLKGGDPYVFGRGGEEAQALAERGLPFEVVPGITSGIAAPAYAGIPVTHRDHASTVTFVTGHEDPTKENSSVDWATLARLKGTRVFFMGVERIRSITESLLKHGAEPETPVALVRWGTTPRQETLEGTLATIADLVEQRGFKAPAITVVGSVVSLRKELNWFERRPLSGKRIVVTRTRTQASALSRQLRELGADVLEIPTIRILPIPAIQEKLRSFPGRFEWLVFTSPNAVEHFFEPFLHLQGDLRRLGSVQIAAVGPATSKKLSEYRLQASKQPEVYTAAALAAAFSPDEIAGKRFCLPRGNLAEPLLPDWLKQNGGTVEEWTVYETVPETADPGGHCARFQESGADWITFTSASTVNNWHALGLKSAPNAPVPRHASIGPVTSEALRALHLPVDLEASPHTVSGLVSTLLKSTL
jgi:uroporphyrinogen III methyltransferase/synthase